MPRALRHEYPGAVYHIMARGDGGKTIFETDDTVSYFSIAWGRFVKAMVGGFTPGC